MGKILSSVTLVAFAALVLGAAHAGDKGKEATLKGTITCAKCDLGKETKCMTVIVVKDKDKKDVTYYFDPAASKKYHGKICTDPMPGTVVGTVSKEGDKNLVTVKSVTYGK